MMKYTEIKRNGTLSGQSNTLIIGTEILLYRLTDGLKGCYGESGDGLTDSDPTIH